MPPFPEISIPFTNVYDEKTENQQINPNVIVYSVGMKSCKYLTSRDMFMLVFEGMSCGLIDTNKKNFKTEKSTVAKKLEGSGHIVNFNDATFDILFVPSVNNILFNDEGQIVHFEFMLTINISAKNESGTIDPKHICVLVPPSIKFTSNNWKEGQRAYARFRIVCNGVICSNIDEKIRLHEFLCTNVIIKPHSVKYKKYKIEDEQKVFRTSSENLPPEQNCNPVNDLSTTNVASHCTQPPFSSVCRTIVIPLNCYNPVT